MRKIAGIIKTASRWRVRGSFTVEASLLMTLILPVLIALLLMGFYVHDQAVLQADTCELTAMGSNLRLEKDVQAQLTQKSQELVQSRLLWGRSVSGTVDVTRTGVSASYTGQFPVPGLAARLFAGNQIPLHAERSRQILRPAKLIWKVRGAKALFELVI